jgi:hypothetical protein
VSYPFRRILPFLSLTLLSGLPAFGATTWTTPTPDELKMTSDPKAPNAEAEFLNLEVVSDEREHTHSVYARIKILTEKGKNEYSDVQMEYIASEESIHAVEGRTIHSDGKIVPFTGQPFDKEMQKTNDFTRMAKVFSMPDVQVGSILEYRYELHYGSQFISPPTWNVQRAIYVRQSSYRFVPDNEVGVASTQILPPGLKVTGAMLGGFDLKAQDIPALPREEFAPPSESIGYRVEFFYTFYTSADDFWKKEGESWSYKVNDFVAPNGKIKQAVDQIVSPSDTDQQKLEKIYAAVMQLENTRFTRAHSRAEEKAQGQKSKSAADIWDQKRGTDDEITGVFVAMARAAKLKAYMMYVTDRERGSFIRQEQTWNQLDDYIAVVVVDGKEMYFDPGQRYCEFGKLKWSHAMSSGVRQMDESKSELASTPAPVFNDTDISRRAAIQIDADGTIHGTMSISMTGNEALRWRQTALRSDEEETKKKFEDELQPNMAPGVIVKTSKFAALTDYTQPLVATIDVSGSIGTRTGHRTFLPGTFFEAQAKPLFATANRESPVDLRYPYMVEDQVKLVLPAGSSLEGVPQDAELPFMPNADFVAKYRGSGTAYVYARRLRVANTLYETKDYSALRDFFQKVNAQDQGQFVVEVGTVTAGASADGGKSE